MEKFDAIVIGAGGVGSAALYHLAKRKIRVLGLDRFWPGHDRGSSHGETRIIRLAYFEHPDYVPLLRRAYELWADLQEQGGQQLYYPVGLLEVGPPDGVMVKGVLESSKRHNLALEEMTAQEANKRFPGFRVPDGHVALFEREAGYLLVEDCVTTHLRLAAEHGATLRTDSVVTNWKPDGDGVIVETERGRYSAGRLIVAAGAWAGRLLGDLSLSLRVLRKHLHWYRTGNPQLDERNGAPGFFFETADGTFYGFPRRTKLGIKVAQHSGGERVGDPLNLDRDVDTAERRRVERFLVRHLLGVSNQATAHTVCMYTMSADENFIVDVHPEHPKVSFAAGLSGHGFKFTSVLGEALADLAQDGATELPVAFLNVRRLTTHP